MIYCLSVSCNDICSIAVCILNISTVSNNIVARKHRPEYPAQKAGCARKTDGA